MNRHENHAKPAHSGLSSHADAAADDGSLTELLGEELSPDDWDASHLPSFAAG